MGRVNFLRLFERKRIKPLSQALNSVCYPVGCYIGFLISDYQTIREKAKSKRGKLKLCKPLGKILCSGFDVIFASQIQDIFRIHIDSILVPMLNFF